MAGVEDIGIPGVGTGILMPALKNRWRLNVNLQNTPFIDEMLHEIAMQIITFKFNYHLQILEMEIEQQSNNSMLHTFVKQLSKLAKTNDYDKIKFVVEGLDGTDKVTYRFLFSSCKLIDHQFDLDYASSDACKHWLKFSFKETKDLT